MRGFDRVELATRGELIQTQGDGESLQIEASPSDLALITTVVRGTTLQIAQVNPGPAPRGPVTCRLAMNKVAGLATSSSGNVRYRGNPPNVTSNASSSGRLIKLD